MSINYKKLFSNTEANVKFKRVSAKNQSLNADIFIKYMYYLIKNNLLFRLKWQKYKVFITKLCIMKSKNKSLLSYS